MKYYVMTPDSKKCMVEYTRFTKTINGMKTSLIKEEGYRSGEIMIRVPETLGELGDWLLDRDMTMNDAVECYGEDTAFWPFLPTSDEDFVDVDDYDHEFMGAFDGCWNDWSVNQWSEEDEEALYVESRYLTSEETSELLEEVYVVYDEFYEEGLEEDGWEHQGCYWEVHCSVTLEESDEYGKVLEEALLEDE